MTLKVLVRKTRFVFWVSKGFFLRHSLKFLLIIFAGVFIFFFFTKFLPQTKLTIPTYTEAIIGQYKKDKMPDRVLKLLSHGLTKINPDGTVSSDIAKSWTTEDSGKTYVFQISNGISWNDGTALNGQNLNISFDKIKTTYKPDQIRFELEDAYSPFLNVLSKPVFKKDTTVGMGDYNLGKVQTDDNGYLTSVYLDPTNSSLPKIHFNFYNSKDNALIALKLGDVEAISDCPCKDEIKDWPNLSTRTITDSEKFVAIFLNTQDDILSTKEVRQALSYAIDKKSLPGKVSLGPISESSVYYNSSLKNYDQNLEKAEELLKDLPKEGRKITLTTVNSFSGVAEKIAEDWKKIGFEVQIKVVDVMDPTRVPFQALLAGQKISTDPDQYTLWHSTQEKTNITKLKSPKVDKLLEDGRKTVEEDKRKEIYSDFQKAIVDELPAIFLYNPDSVYSVKKKSEYKVENIRKETKNFWPN